MVTVDYSPNFASIFKRIKDSALRERVRGQIKKIISKPEAGKPMKYARKGTRELYVASFRLSYAYIKAENKVILLDLYHKDRQ